MELIDFTNCKEEFNVYKGSEKKKTLIYNNKRYLVKFPDPIREKKKNVSYINNAYSEYIGSNIFKLLGFEVQNTILGKYVFNDKPKIVCACEDFTSSDNKLYEFESLALSINPEKKIGTQLNEIMDILSECQNLIDVDDTKTKFWKMFIVDFFIGNTDRHNGNWGFLKKDVEEKAYFSPIYDCGSCLNPILSDEQIQKISDVEVKNLGLNVYSALRENNKKINYSDYILSLKNNECNNALKSVFPKINTNMIFEFIDKLPIESHRKEFYQKLIEIRYEEVLKKAYNKIK